jgi:predicted nucleic acid-binding Zn ribbon protein
MKHAKRIGSLLNELFDQPGLGEQLSRHQAWLIWDKLVGEQIAARARPLRLRRNILEVQVDHPVWMQQLQMLKPQILKKIAEQLPGAGITDLYLRQTRKGTGTRPKVKHEEVRPDWTKIELKSEELQQIDEELNTINDENLREILRQFRIKQKKLDKSRKK